MSNRSRSRWVWRVLGMFIIGAGAFFGTRTWLLMAGSQSSQVGYDVYGNQYQVYDPISSPVGAFPTYSPTPVSHPSPGTLPQVPTPNPPASLVSNGQLQPPSSSNFQNPNATVPLPSPAESSPASPQLPRITSPRLADAAAARSQLASRVISAEVSQLLSRLRSLDDQDSEEVKKLKTELRRALEGEFDKKHQQHQQSIANLEEQLDRARQLYSKRESNKSEIIDRRIAQLLGQSDDLAWDLNEIKSEPKRDLLNPNPIQSLPAANIHNVSCGDANAVFVHEFLKAQFEDHQGVEVQVNEQLNTLIVISDNEASASRVISMIKATVDAMVPAKNRRQPVRNDLPSQNNFNSFQPAPANPLTSAYNWNANSLLPSNSRDDRGPATPNAFRSNARPSNLAANSTGSFVPRRDNNNLSARPINQPPPSFNPPPATLRLTLASEDRVQIEMTPRRLGFLPTVQTLANVKDGLSGIQPGTIQKVDIITPADTKIEVTSQLIRQVQRVCPATITVKHQNVNLTNPPVDASAGGLVPSNTSSLTMPTRQPAKQQSRGNQGASNYRSLDSTSSDSRPQPEKTGSNNLLPREDVLQEEPMTDEAREEIREDRLLESTSNNSQPIDNQSADKKFVDKPLADNSLGGKQPGDIQQLDDAASEPLAESTVSTSEETKRVNRLRKIGLALHNYHDAHRRFPFTENQPLSWRVRILPYLDQKELFDSFDPQKAWNSKENLPLGRQPNEAFGVAEKEIACWVKSNVESLKDVTDGSSNTIALVMIPQSFRWTEPRDVTPDEVVEIVANLGEGATLLTVRYDGRVMSVPYSVSPNELKALLTPSGGEVVDVK